MHQNHAIFLIFGKQSSGKSILANSLQSEFKGSFDVYEVPPIDQMYVKWFEDLKKICSKRKIEGVFILHAGHSPRLDVEQLFYYLFVKNHFHPIEHQKIAVFLTFVDFLKTKDSSLFWNELENSLKEKGVEFTTRGNLLFNQNEEVYGLPDWLRKKSNFSVSKVFQGVSFLSSRDPDIIFHPGISILKYSKTIKQIYDICFGEDESSKIKEVITKTEEKKQQDEIANISKETIMIQTTMDKMQQDDEKNEGTAKMDSTIGKEGESFDVTSDNNENCHKKHQRGLEDSASMNNEKMIEKNTYDLSPKTRKENLSEKDDKMQQDDEKNEGTAKMDSTIGKEGESFDVTSDNNENCHKKHQGGLDDSASMNNEKMIEKNTCDLSPKTRKENLSEKDDKMQQDDEKDEGTAKMDSIIGMNNE